MGVFSEYLDAAYDRDAERKKQLRRVADIRGRDVLVYAADGRKAHPGVIISDSDILPISDQLENLKGSKLDLIVETPGGLAEITELIVRMLRKQYDDIHVIVPGAAMSAGTMLALSADEILMDPKSALGPIDAQINRQGKSFSADALIKGFERIKDEAAKTGQLNRAYIPILQAISPGELEGAQNALDLAKDLVTDWLFKYKFRHWVTHASSGNPVTPEERLQKANEIATMLCKHSHWRSHSRRLTITDLEALGLKIVDYSKEADLADALRRYHVLMQLSFEGPLYKIYETPDSNIYRHVGPVGPEMAAGGAGPMPIIPGIPQLPPGRVAAEVGMEVRCGKCGQAHDVQINIGQPRPLKPGRIPFPANNVLKCTKCGKDINLAAQRVGLEQQLGGKIVT